MGRQLKRRIEIFAVNRGGLQSVAWGIAGAAIFLIGTFLGAGLDGIAIWILFAGFLTVTPLLVLAGLLYNFQADPGSALPSFKTLLTLMLLCWGALDILALGTFGFNWSNAGRLALLLVISALLAFLIFSQFIKPKNRELTPSDEPEPLLITFES
jgi:hypothetical protein